MSTTHSLRVEAMTEAAFAPYGWLIDAPQHPPDHRPLFPSTFDCRGETTINTIWQPYAGRNFTHLERHFAVTQTFFQLSGAPSVVCVAPPTDMNDPHAIPDPGTVRAFLIDAGKGFGFAIGTWHSLDRYVLAPPGATFVILNVNPNPTQMVDFASGESLHYDDLAQGAVPRREQLAGNFGARFELTL